MEKTNIPEIRVRIEKVLAGERSTKAFARLTLANAFAVHGIRVVETDAGLKVRMPFRSYQSGNETKYQDYFHAVTGEARGILEKAILDAYTLAIRQDQRETDQAASAFQQI